MQRATEQRLTLETYHNAFGEDIIQYRLLTKVHTMTGENAAEIRQLLREKYVFHTSSDLVPA